MRKGEVGWAIALAGLPFSHLLFRPLDPWHGQAAWAQAWMLGLWGYSLTQERLSIPIKPLGILIAWVYLTTCFWWVQMIKAVKGYPVGMLQGVVHATIIIMAIQSFITLVDKSFLTKLVKIIAIVSIILAIYGICQMLMLDQFFKSLDDAFGKDELVGTIGNTTHYGTQLALAVPFIWIQQGRLWKLGLLLVLGIIAATGSSTALGASFLAVCFMLFRTHRKISLSLLATGIAAGIGVLLFRSGHWFDLQGRWEAWGAFWELFKQGDREITGLGIGWVMDYSRSNPVGPLRVGNQLWRHVHNEWFQMLIESGVVGFSLAIWVAWDWLKNWISLPKTPVAWAFGATMLVALASSLTSFPLHLWGLGYMILVAYAGTYVMSREEPWQAI